MIIQLMNNLKPTIKILDDQQYNFDSVRKLLLDRTIQLISATCVRGRAINFLLTQLEESHLNAETFVDKNKAILVDMNIDITLEGGISIKEFISGAIEKFLTKETQIAATPLTSHSSDELNTSSPVTSGLLYRHNKDYDLFAKKMKSTEMTSKRSPKLPGGKDCDANMMRFLKQSNLASVIMKILKSEYSLVMTVHTKRNLMETVNLIGISTVEIKFDEVVLEADSILPLIEILSFATITLDEAESVLNTGVSLLVAIYTTAQEFLQVSQESNLCTLYSLIIKTMQTVSEMFSRLKLAEPNRVFNGLATMAFHKYSIKTQQQRSSEMITSNAKYLAISKHILLQINTLKEEESTESEIDWKESVDVGTEVSFKKLIQTSSRKWLTAILDKEKHMSVVLFWLNFLKDNLLQVIGKAREHSVVTIKVAEPILYVDEDEPPTDDFGLDELFRECGSERGKPTGPESISSFMRLDSQSLESEIQKLRSQNLKEIFSMLSNMTTSTHRSIRVILRNQFDNEALQFLIEVADILDEELNCMNSTVLVSVAEMISRFVHFVREIFQNGIVNQRKSIYILKLLSVDLSKAGQDPSVADSTMLLDMGPMNTLILTHLTILFTSGSSLSQHDMDDHNMADVNLMAELGLTNDKLISSLWNHMLSAVKFHVINTRDRVIDVKKEFIQYFLMVFHALNSVKAKEVFVLDLLQCIKDCVQDTDIVQSRLLGRLLLLLNYFMHHFYEQAPSLAHQIQFNLVTRHVTDVPNEDSAYHYKEVQMLDRKTNTCFYDIMMPWPVINKMWPGPNVDTMIWKRLVKSPNYSNILQSVLKTIQLTIDARWSSKDPNNSIKRSLANAFYGFLTTSRLLEVLPPTLDFVRSGFDDSSFVHVLYGLYQRSSDSQKNSTSGTMIKMMLMEESVLDSSSDVTKPPGSSYQLWRVDNLLDMTKLIKTMCSDALNTLDFNDLPARLFQVDQLLIYVNYAYKCYKEDLISKSNNKTLQSKCFMIDTEESNSKLAVPLLCQILEVYGLIEQLTSKYLKNSASIEHAIFYPTVLDKSFLETKLTGIDLESLKVMTDVSEEFLMASSDINDNEDQTVSFKTAKEVYQKHFDCPFINNHDNVIEAMRREGHNHFYYLLEDDRQNSKNQSTIILQHLSLLLVDLISTISLMDTSTVEQSSTETQIQLVTKLVFSLSGSVTHRSQMSSITPLFSVIPNSVYTHVLTNSLLSLFRFLAESLSNEVLSRSKIFLLMEHIAFILTSIIDQLTNATSAKSFVDSFTESNSETKPHLDCLFDVLITSELHIPSSLQCSILQIFVLILDKYYIKKETKLGASFEEMVKTINNFGQKRSDLIYKWLKSVLENDDTIVSEYLALLILFTQKLVLTSTSEIEIEKESLPMVMIKSILKLDECVRRWISELRTSDSRSSGLRPLNLHAITDILCYLLNSNCSLSLYINVVQTLLDWSSEISNSVFGANQQTAEDLLSSNEMQILCASLTLIYNHVSAIMCALNTQFDCNAAEQSLTIKWQSAGQVLGGTPAGSRLYLNEETMLQMGMSKLQIEKLLFTQAKLRGGTKTDATPMDGIEDELREQVVSTNPLDEQLCTFAATNKEFTEQHWYHCFTCKMVENEGVCTVCAKVCHMGHDLSYAKKGSFFCDCGARGLPFCEALARRAPGAAVVAASGSGRTTRSGALSTRTGLLAASGGRGSTTSNRPPPLPPHSVQSQQQRLVAGPGSSSGSTSAPGVSSGTTAAERSKINSITSMAKLARANVPVEKLLRKTLKSESRSRVTVSDYKLPMRVCGASTSGGSMPPAISAASAASASTTAAVSVSPASNSGSIHRGYATRRKLGTSSILSGLMTPSSSVKPDLSLLSFDQQSNRRFTPVDLNSKFVSPGSIMPILTAESTAEDKNEQTDNEVIYQLKVYRLWVIRNLRKRLQTESETLTVLLETSSLLEDCISVMSGIGQPLQSVYERWTVHKIDQVKQAYTSVRSDLKSAEPHTIMFLVANQLAGTANADSARLQPHSHTTGSNVLVPTTGAASAARLSTLSVNPGLTTVSTTAATPQLPLSSSTISATNDALSLVETYLLSELNSGNVGRNSTAAALRRRLGASGAAVAPALAGTHQQNTNMRSRVPELTGPAMQLRSGSSDITHDLSGIPNTSGLVNELAGLSSQARNVLLSGFLRRNVLAVLNPVATDQHFLAVALTAGVNASGGSGANYDKARIVIYRITSLLEHLGQIGQPPSAIRTDLMEQVCTATLPFTALSMAVNPTSQQIVSVCGFKDVSVLTFTAMGSVSGKIHLMPVLEDSNQFIIKSLWLPGSVSHLVLVLTQSVQIFDITHSCLQPLFHFKSVEARFKDATFAFLRPRHKQQESVSSNPIDATVVDPLDCYILVMSDSGCVHCKKLDKDCAGSGGFYLAEMLDWNPEIFDMIRDSKTGVLGKGGASIHYDHSLQLLMHSYANGRTFCTVIEGGADEIYVDNNFLVSFTREENKELVLVNWQSQSHQPGLLSAVCKNTNMPFYLLVEPYCFKYQVLDKSSMKPAPLQSSEGRSPPPPAVVAPGTPQALTPTAATSPNTANTTSSVEETVVLSDNGLNGSGIKVTDTVTFFCRRHRCSVSLILYYDGRIQLFVNDTSQKKQFWTQPKFTNKFLYHCLDGTASDPCKNASIPKLSITSVSAASNKLNRPLIDKTVSARDEIFLDDPSYGPVPVDFFEHCELTKEVSFGGDRLLELYSQDVLNSRMLNMEQNVTVACKNPVNIVITNKMSSDSVIVGVRVGINSSDPSKIPAYFEVYGRRLLVSDNVSTNRDIDIGLYKSEILHNEKSLTLIVGHAHEMISLDYIKVFVRSRASMSWLVQERKHSFMDNKDFFATKSTRANNTNQMSQPLKQRVAISTEQTVKAHQLDLTHKGQDNRPIPRSDVISSGMQLLTAAIHFRKTLNQEERPTFAAPEDSLGPRASQFANKLISSFLPTDAVLNAVVLIGCLNTSGRKGLSAEENQFEIANAVTKNLYLYAKKTIDDLEQEALIDPKNVARLESAVLRLCNIAMQTSPTVAPTVYRRSEAVDLLLRAIRLVVVHHLSCNCVSPLLPDPKNMAPIELLAHDLLPLYYRRLDHLPSLLGPLINSLFFLTQPPTDIVSIDTQLDDEAQRMDLLYDRMARDVLQLLLHPIPQISHNVRKTVGQYLMSSSSVVQSQTLLTTVDLAECTIAAAGGCGGVPAVTTSTADDSLLSSQQVEATTTPTLVCHQEERAKEEPVSVDKRAVPQASQLQEEVLSSVPTTTESESARAMLTETIMTTTREVDDTDLCVTNAATSSAFAATVSSAAIIQVADDEQDEDDEDEDDEDDDDEDDDDDDDITTPFSIEQAMENLMQQEEEQALAAQNVTQMVDLALHKSLMEEQQQQEDQQHRSELLELTATTEEAQDVVQSADDQQQQTEQRSGNNTGGATVDTWIINRQANKSTVPTGARSPVLSTMTLPANESTSNPDSREYSESNSETDLVNLGIIKQPDARVSSGTAADAISVNENSAATLGAMHAFSARFLKVVNLQWQSGQLISNLDGATSLSLFRCVLDVLHCVDMTDNEIRNSVRQLLSQMGDVVVEYDYSAQPVSNPDTKPGFGGRCVSSELVCVVMRVLLNLILSTTGTASSTGATATGPDTSKDENNSTSVPSDGTGSSSSSLEAVLNATLTMIQDKALLPAVLTGLETLLPFWRTHTVIDKTRQMAAKLNKEVDVKQLLKGLCPSASSLSSGSRFSSTNCSPENTPFIVTELSLRLPYAVHKLCKSVSKGKIVGLYNKELGKSSLKIDNNIHKHEVKHTDQPLSEDAQQLMQFDLMDRKLLIAELSEQLLRENKWHSVLCELLEMAISDNISRASRTLLNSIVGTKHYRTVRDIHLLGGCVSHLTILFNVSESGKRNNLQRMDYHTQVKIVELLDQCISKAKERPQNWKIYCSKCPDVLPLLLKSSITVHEQPVMALKLLYLLQLAVLDPDSSKKQPPVSAHATTSSTVSARAAPLAKKETAETTRRSTAAASATTAATSAAVVPKLEGKLCRALVAKTSMQSLAQFAFIYVCQFPDPQIRWLTEAVVVNLYTKNKSNTEWRDEFLQCIIENVWQQQQEAGSVSQHTVSEQLLDLVGHLVACETSSAATATSRSVNNNDLGQRVVSVALAQMTGLGRHLLMLPETRLYSYLERVARLGSRHLGGENAENGGCACLTRLLLLDRNNGAAMRTYHWDSEPADSRRTQARAATICGMGLHQTATMVEPEQQQHPPPQSSLLPSVRANPNTHVFNLRAHFTIQSISLKLASASSRRPRPACTLHLFYSDLSTLSTTQMLEHTDLWNPLSTHYIARDAAELKIELPLPLTAVYLIFKYDLTSSAAAAVGGKCEGSVAVQDPTSVTGGVGTSIVAALSSMSGAATPSATTIKCPRCHSSSIQGNVCLNCRDNINQCFRCRAINYAGLDSFICASCSSCRYGRIDFFMTAKPCYDFIEEIHSEESREVMIGRITSWSELVDKNGEEMAALRTDMEDLINELKLRDASDFTGVIKTMPEKVPSMLTSGAGISAGGTSGTQVGGRACALSMMTRKKQSAASINGAANKLAAANAARSYADTIMDDVGSGARPYRRMRCPAGTEADACGNLESDTTGAKDDDTKQHQVASPGEQGSAMKVSGRIHDALFQLLTRYTGDFRQQQSQLVSLCCQLSAAKRAVALYDSNSATAVLLDEVQPRSVVVEQLLGSHERPQEESPAAAVVSGCYSCTLLRLQQYAWLVRALSVLPNTKVHVTSISSLHQILPLVLAPGGLLDVVPSAVRPEFMDLAVACTRDNRLQVKLLNEFVSRELLVPLSAVQWQKAGEEVVAPQPLQLAQEVRAHLSLAVLRASVCLGDSQWQLRLRPALLVLKALSRSRAAVSEHSMRLVVAPCISLLQAVATVREPLLATTPPFSPSFLIMDSALWLSSDNEDNDDNDSGLFKMWLRLSQLGVQQDTDPQLEEGQTVHLSDTVVRCARKWTLRLVKRRLGTSALPYLFQQQHKVSAWLVRVLNSKYSRPYALSLLEKVASGGCDESRRLVLAVLVASLPCLLDNGRSSTAVPQLAALIVHLTEPAHWRCWLVLATPLISQLDHCMHAALQQLASAEEAALRAWTDSTHQLQQQHRSTGRGLAAFHTLRGLADLLIHLQELPQIGHKYRTTFVRSLLSTSLTLRHLVVFRSKMTADAETTFNGIVNGLSKHSEETIHSFIKIAVNVMKDFPESDLQSAGHIIDKINAYICPRDYEHPVFEVLLEIFKGQEDFLPHRMVGVPISHDQFGRNATVNDVVNYMVRENGLATDVRLDVICDRKVLRNDLLLEDIYEQVWLVAVNNEATAANQQHQGVGSSNRGKPMRLTLRICGFVEDNMPYLETLRKEVPLDHYRRASPLADDDDGLQCVLRRLTAVVEQGLARGCGVVAAATRLLRYFVQVPGNDNRLLEPALNTIKVLLQATVVCLEDEASLDVKKMSEFEDNTLVPMLELLGRLLLLARTRPDVEGSTFATAALHHHWLRSQLPESEVDRLLRLVLASPGRDLYQRHVTRLLPLLVVLSPSVESTTDEPLASHADRVLNQLQPVLARLVPNAVFTDHEKTLLQCCCRILTGIPSDRYGSCLRKRMLDRGILGICIEFLLATAPPDALKMQESDDMKLDTKRADVSLFLEQPALTLVLELGHACVGSSKTEQQLDQASSADNSSATDTFEQAGQVMLATPGLMGLLHRLELVKSVEAIGVLAEDWLSSIKENGGEAGREAERLRQQTQKQLRERARLVRKKQMEEMRLRAANTGAVVAGGNEAAGGGGVAAAAAAPMMEEPGYACAICQEGHINKPQEPLGVYVFVRKIPVHDLLAQPPAVQATSGLSSGGPLFPIPASVPCASQHYYSAVSSFVCVHFSCHASSVKAALVSESEWTVAQRHNQNARCNSLLPILGPLPTDSAAYKTHLNRYMASIWNNANVPEINYQLVLHDLKFLLLRFAQMRQFNEDTGGGARLSNMRLVPHLVQVAITNLFVQPDLVVKETSALTKWIEPGKITVQQAWQAANPVLRAVQCAVLQADPEVWRREWLPALVRMLIQFAYVRWSAVTSSTAAASAGTPDSSKANKWRPVPAEGSTEWCTVFRPLLVMVGLLHLMRERLLEPALTADYGTDDKAAAAASGSSWLELVSGHLRCKETSVLEACSDMVNVYEQRLIVSIDSVAALWAALGLEAPADCASLYSSITTAAAVTDIA